MAEKLGDVEARIGTVHQLESVVGAMRALAAARAREARARLAGIQAYAGTVGEAIGVALSLLPEDGHPSIGGEAPGGLLIAFCAEQGFVGGFNERLLDAVGEARAGRELLLIGDRGVMVAEERGWPVAWSMPAPAHADEVAGLADRLADRIYERIAAGAGATALLLHARPATGATTEIVRRPLIPLDFGRFPVARRAPPLVTLPPGRLLEGLAAEYLFAELCEAAMLSLAAENEARMTAMINARTNVAKTLEELHRTAAHLRQDAITAEVIELAAGSAARRG